jgi:hypothetical protein
MLSLPSVGSDRRRRQLEPIQMGYQCLRTGIIREETTTVIR